MIHPTTPLIQCSNFENFVETHFTRPGSSVEKLESARIILLGETHEQENHQLKHAGVIEHLYQKGDIILIEAPDRFASCNRQLIPFVKKKITLHGWDSPIREKIDPWRHRKTIIKILALVHKIRTNTTVQKDELAKAAIELRSFQPKEQHTDTYKKFGIQWESPKDDMTPDNLKDFNKIVTKVSIAWNKYLNAEISNVFEIRQKSLVVSLKKHSTPSNKVFVIGGELHFCNNNIVSPDHLCFESIVDGIKTLTDYLEDKSFVLLIPNENEESIPFLRKKFISKIARTKIAYNKTMSTCCMQTPILRSIYNYFQNIKSYETRLQKLTDAELISKLEDLIDQ